MPGDSVCIFIKTGENIDTDHNGVNCILVDGSSTNTSALLIRNK